TSPFGRLFAWSPPEFTTYHAHHTNLACRQKLDYTMLCGLFRERMRKEGWRADSQFNWNNGSVLEKGTLLPEEYILYVKYVEDHVWNPYCM
ncbi:hypothetical protein C8Q73DRAFT_655757, partial [Cubamyces lactineus]